ncbi:MAG: nitrilase-related carbon-nitrogen hydrolase [Bdellovibrionota bacterium]
MKLKLNPNALVLIFLFSTLSCSHTHKDNKPKSSLRGYELKNTLRVATSQYKIQGNQSVDGISRKVEALIKEAAAKKAELLIFPELFVLDAWPLKSKKTEAEIVQLMINEYAPALLEQAKQWSEQYQIAILLGSFPRVTSSSKIRNTAYLFFSNGEVFFQDKVYLTAWEKSMGWEAGEAIQVRDSPLGRFVILICYDVEFPKISQDLVTEKPELILVPSMTESLSGLERVRWAAQARAVEHHAFVVISGTVGKVSRDWVHYGQAAFVSPRDNFFKEKVVQGILNKPGLVFSELNLKKLRESRKQSKYYPAKDQAL